MRRSWRFASLPFASLRFTRGHWHLQRCWAFPTGWVGKFTRTPKRCRNLWTSWEIDGRYIREMVGNSLEIRISPSGIYGNGSLNGIWRAINDYKWGSTGNIIRIQPEVGWNHSNPKKMPQKLEILENSASFRIFLGVATAEMRISSTKVKIWSAEMIHSPIKIDPDPSSVIKRGWRKTCVWW